MGDELVVEDGGVDLDLDEVDGDGGDLGDHHAAEGVGHARVGLSELELAVIVLHFSDPDLGKSLVGDGGLHCWRFLSFDGFCPLFGSEIRVLVFEREREGFRLISGRMGLNSSETGLRWSIGFVRWAQLVVQMVQPSKAHQPIYSVIKVAKFNTW